MKKEKLICMLCMMSICSVDMVAYAEQAIEIGEKVEVSTAYGNYNITIDNISKSDWLERSGDNTEGMEVVLLECDIENINFEDPYNSVFFLENYLSVLDSEGYVVNSYGLGYDDGEYKMNAKIPKGAKAKVVVPYKVNSDANELEITINGQYTIDAVISNDDISEGEMKNEESDNQNSELQAKVEELTAENEELKLQIETLMSEKTELQSQIDKQQETESESVEEIQTEAIQPSTDIVGVQYSDKSIVQIVQTALNKEGFDCGTPDGLAGNKTTEAIKEYQENAGINVNGVITDELLEALGVADKVDEAAKLEASKSEYSADYSYEQLARNPDSYIGDKVKFSGKVLQAETGDTCYMRLAANDDYDTVLFITYSKDTLDYRLLEDDYVTVYGTAYSTYSYEAVSGATITLPWINADIIELN